MEQTPFPAGRQPCPDPGYSLPPEQNPYYKKRERRNLSRIGAALSGYLLLVSVVQLAISAVSARFFLPFFESEGYSWIVLLLPAYLIGFPLFWGFLSSMPKKTPERKKLGAAGWISFLAVSFFLLLAGNYISSGLMTVIETVRGTDISNIINNQIVRSSWLMNLIVVSIITPIFEELMFRKLIVDRLLPYSEWLALITSALFFGLMHGNFYQFFYAAFLGMLFSYVYIKTGNILHTIAMHMIINFTGSIIALRINELTSGTIGVSSSINPWAIISGLYSLGALVLAGCGLVFLINRLKKPNLKKTGGRLLTLPTQFRLTWLNAGTIVFLCLCAFMFLSSLFI